MYPLSNHDHRLLTGPQVFMAVITLRRYSGYFQTLEPSSVAHLSDYWVKSPIYHLSHATTRAANVSLPPEFVQSALSYIIALQWMECFFDHLSHYATEMTGLNNQIISN